MMDVKTDKDAKMGDPVYVQFGPKRWVVTQGTDARWVVHCDACGDFHILNTRDAAQRLAALFNRWEQWLWDLKYPKQIVISGSNVSCVQYAFRGSSRTTDGWYLKLWGETRFYFDVEPSWLRRKIISWLVGGTWHNDTK